MDHEENTDNYSIPTAVPLPDSIYETIELEAYKQGISASAFIRKAVEFCSDDKEIIRELALKDRPLDCKLRRVYFPSNMLNQLNSWSLEFKADRNIVIYHMCQRYLALGKENRR